MQPYIMTVTGPAAPEELGIFLPHEHIMSTFGADPARYPEYPVDALLERVLPYLERMKTLGLGALADCTAAFFGRHPELLRRISVESGVRLLTNTGYYGAAYDRYIPPHAYRETAEQISARWTREWQDGIDETGIRPGFIKTAVGDGPLLEIDRTLIRAAALTHLQTGLTIQTHTGDNWQAAGEMLDIFHAEGAHPSAWVWVHAHSMPEPERLLETARQGAWISLDGLSQQRAGHILGFLQGLKREGLLGQALLSHDGDLYCFGEFRPFEYLLTEFIPLLQENGFTQEEVKRLTADNPARAFTVQVRES